MHHVQGEASVVTPAELPSLLQELYKDTLALFRARQANALSVAGYDANNGYQQVLGRQEVHLRWLADAIEQSGGAVEEASHDGSGARRQKDAKAVIEGDVQAQRAFLDRWSPRVESLTNARNRKMVELVLGEMREHLRVLELAARDRPDLLGRHADGRVLRGTVMPTRPKN